MREAQIYIKQKKNRNISLSWGGGGRLSTGGSIPPPKVGVKISLPPGGGAHALHYVITYVISLSCISLTISPIILSRVNDKYADYFENSFSILI